MVRQQSSPRSRQGFGVGPRDYRRGIEEKKGTMQWQKLWHFNEACDDYPTQNFAVRKDRPLDDDLRSKCHRTAFA